MISYIILGAVVVGIVVLNYLLVFIDYLKRTKEQKMNPHLVFCFNCNNCIKKNGGYTFAKCALTKTVEEDGNYIVGGITTKRKISYSYCACERQDDRIGRCGSEGKNFVRK